MAALKSALDLSCDSVVRDPEVQSKWTRALRPPPEINVPKSNHAYWTDFKKKHADFEKQAVVKQDLGPALDLFDRAYNKIESGGTPQEMQRALESGKAAVRVIKAALAAYEQRVKAARLNPQMTRDFETVKGLIEAQLGHFS